MQHHVEFPLLDVPLPWLSQLASTPMDKRSKQCLLGTCKVLRDLGFGQADRVVCKVSRGTVEAVKAASSLQLLTRCKEGANVQLLLKGDVLGDIIPLELAMACPNMTRFIRWGHLNTWRDQGFAPVACPQVRQLSIQNLTQRQSLFGNSRLSVQQLQQQLKSLPNLQHMECEVMKEGDLDDFIFLMGSVQVLSQQLTSLHFGYHGSARLALLFRSPWPNLLTLRIPQQEVEGNDLQVIFEHAPLLRELEVDYIDDNTNVMHLEGCRLQALTVGVVYLHELSHWPFKYLQKLSFSKLAIDGSYTEYVDMATKKLVSIGRIVSTRPDGLSSIGFEIDRDEDPEPTPAVLSLLSLIPHKAVLLSCGYHAGVGKPWLQLFADLGCHTGIGSPGCDTRLLGHTSAAAATAAKPSTGA